ncbi:hypothetical protein, partial [Klebsiella pneumoniae]|uniref:hypothetical protein n=1 Tax=Klebsiella pneumoniae TaxID=573 RepID=UPI003EE27358
LVDLSNYLSKHSSIKKDELKEMASKYVDVSDLKTRETYYDFRDRLEALYQALPQEIVNVSEND